MTSSSESPQSLGVEDALRSDPNLLTDFIAAFEEHTETIQKDIATLKEDQGDMGTINDLFRSLHNVKGDARASFLLPVAEYVHILENIIGMVRDKKTSFTSGLGDLILTALESLMIQCRETAENRDMAFPGLLPPKSSLEFFQIQMDMSTADEVAVKVLGLVTQAGNPKSPVTVDDSTHLIVSELAFFEEITHQMERRFPYYLGRVERMLPLLLEMNEVADCPVKPDQLKAAFYIHDLGMTLLPDAVLKKPDAFTPDEVAPLREHPKLSARFLELTDHWQEAAKIILQHHERVDGSGYPHGLIEAEICEGAKMLSIIDVFGALTSNRPHRDGKHSLLESVSEINGLSGTQFSPYWVAIFNQVLRDYVIQIRKKRQKE